tara:strand:- start:70 stop:918 length:849 start_codon:yes stop_codon:yes gene_type:complete
MERIYKKSTKDFYSLIFLLSLSIATIIIDHKYNQADYARSFINDLIVYPLYNLSSIPRSMITSFMKEQEDIKILNSQIEDLKAENMSLKIKLQEFDSLKEENERLLAIEKKSLTSTKKQKIAKVLNNSASPTRKIAIIDKGQNDGLFKAQNVIGVKGLIGQIIELNMMSSKIILINDINHNVPGNISRTGEKVIVAGSNGDNDLMIQFAPIDTDIKVGDIITTSGVAGRFKSNIPIGKVVSITKDPEKKFSAIDVKSFENLDNLSDIILIWDYQPSTETKNE